MSEDDRLVEILKIIETILNSPNDFTYEEQLKLRKIASELYVNRHHQIDLETMIESFREILDE